MFAGNSTHKAGVARITVSRLERNRGQVLRRVRARAGREGQEVFASPKLRIGLTGSGFMRKAHAFGYTTAARVFDLPFELELRTIADINDEAAAKAAAALGCAREVGLPLAGRRSRYRPRQHHHAQRAAQGNGAGGDRRGQARLLRKAYKQRRLIEEKMASNRSTSRWRAQGRPEGIGRRSRGFWMANRGARRSRAPPSLSS